MIFFCLPTMTMKVSNIIHSLIHNINNIMSTLQCLESLSELNDEINASIQYGQIQWINV